MAAQQHWQPCGSTPLMVHMLTGARKGPDPALIWGHGSVCVFPQVIESPIWIPEWLVCPMDGSPDHQPRPTGTMGPSQESISAEAERPGYSHVAVHPFH